MRRIIISLVTILPFLCASAEGLTVTDVNGVIYDVIDKNTRTVSVSSKNSQGFRDLAVDVTIPAEVEDVSTASTGGIYQVVGMSQNAFYSTPIKSVTISAPLVTIPQNAFGECKQLSSVSISEGTKSIGQSAFYNCSALTEVELPSTVTSIGIASFMNCSSLEEIRLPNSLEKIEGRAFANCERLKFPILPYSLNEICYDAFSYCKNLGTVKLTPGTLLGKESFKYSHITNIIFPEEAMGNWGTGVFSGVDGLTSVEIPGWQTNVPDLTFCNCADIQHVTIMGG